MGILIFILEVLSFTMNILATFSPIGAQSVDYFTISPQDKQLVRQETFMNPQHISIIRIKNKAQNTRKIFSTKDLSILQSQQSRDHGSHLYRRSI